jgi:hypothetical protein
MRAHVYRRGHVVIFPLQIRQKFVLVSWCGPEVKALKKAKMSVHKVGGRGWSL